MHERSKEGTVVDSFRSFRHLGTPFRIALADLLIAVVIGCGGGGNPTPTPPPPQPPVIQSFSANPLTITAGQSSTLSWTTSGATSLSIDQGVGTVTSTSKVVTPIMTTTYTLTATNDSGYATETVTVTVSSTSVVRIIYLHHSTGAVIWGGGVQDQVNAYNTAHGTQYQITEMNYPSGDHGYPWDNYPYDYWNLWVHFTGANRDREELNLDDLVAQYDVIVFKHCFPGSAVEPPDGNPNVASDARTIANYQLQYEALKTRMRQFPSKKFLLWTGAALRKLDTNRDQALRAKQVFDWVKINWNEAGDNLFVWDFRALQTVGSEEGLYLNDAFSSDDSHPSDTFAQTVAPFFVKRLVDVIEGRGDSGSITGN